MTDSELARLWAELRAARRLLAALEARLADAQVASEGAYRAAYDADGGPRFDPAQPFGTKPTHWSVS